MMTRATIRARVSSKTRAIAMTSAIANARARTRTRTRTVTCDHPLPPSPHHISFLATRMLCYSTSTCVKTIHPRV